MLVVWDSEADKGAPLEECVTWRDEIRELWKKVGRISGERNTSGDGRTRMYEGKKGSLLGGAYGRSVGRFDGRQEVYRSDTGFP